MPGQESEAKEKMWSSLSRHKQVFEEEEENTLELPKPARSELGKNFTYKKDRDDISNLCLIDKTSQNSQWHVKTWKKAIYLIFKTRMIPSEKTLDGRIRKSCPCSLHTCQPHGNGQGFYFLSLLLETKTPLFVLLIFLTVCVLGSEQNFWKVGCFSERVMILIYVSWFALILWGYFPSFKKQASLSNLLDVLVLLRFERFT